MLAMNRVLLGGTIAREPEIIQTNRGTPIAKFILKTNTHFTSASGVRKQEASYFEVDSFGDAANIIGNDFSKGDFVLIDGRLKQERWESKAGSICTRIKVIVSSISHAEKELTRETDKEEYLETVSAPTF